MRLITTLLISVLLISAASVTFITVKPEPVLSLNKGPGSSGASIPHADFTLGNVLPSQFLLQVTGNQGDFAQTILEMSGGYQLSRSQPDARPGAGVSIHATGMLPTDSTCQLSSPSSPNVILPGTAACVIRLGSGVAYGGFTVGNVLPGQYVIQITGNQGDTAQTIIAVG